jgi:DNA polymerase-1
MYLDYKAHKAGVYVIDIETDDLNATRIWCMCWRNLLTGEVGECTTDESIIDFFKDTRGAYYVGHNIIKFDGPTIKRLLGPHLGSSNCIDTLILSTLYSPSLEGGHSLDAWGERIGEPKTHFNDWSGLTKEMVEYCHQDVLVTSKLFVRLMRTLERIGFTEQSIWIQHHVTDAIRQQHDNGFYFNEQAAVALYSELRHLERGLENEVREIFPAKRVLVAERRMFKKDGTPTVLYLRDKERYMLECEDSRGVYRAFDSVEFNLGSSIQRIDKLLSLGWRPRTFTEKGNPKPFDKGNLSPCLQELLEESPVPEVLFIARWMAYNGRANTVNTWLDNYNEKTHCIHGKLFVADTLRFRHQAPNTANIPAVRVTKSGEVLRGMEGLFTYEARDVWCARPGRVLVGTDAAGLELRMLAHYLNRPDFTEQVVNGDPHQYNADLAGVTRPQAKTLIYAILYGAGGVKIAKTLGLRVDTRTNRDGEIFEVSDEGEEMKQMFLQRLGADKLVEEAKNEQRNGRVTLCDGSKVVCPSPHAALNYKLQGGGARVMALGCVLLERTIRSKRLDSLKVGDIHDEWQYDVNPRDAEDHAREAVQAIRDSGKYLRLNVPLDGESKIGGTWAETH